MSHEKTIQVLSHIDPALVEECAVCRGSVPSERNGMNHRKSSARRLAVLVAALCLLLALAVTAYATGAIQSLISKYWSGFHYVTPDETLREERPDYAQWLEEQLKTQAMMCSIGEQAVPTQVPYTIPGLDNAGVTLLEYYYDGEKLALGCQFQAPSNPVDFSFNPADFPNLPFQMVGENGYPSYTGMVKDQQALERITRTLQKEGTVSFLVQDAWLSDHVYANGEDLGCCHTDPEEQGFFLVDPIVAGIGDVVLPESCRNLAEIQVSLTYRVSTYAFVLDGDAVRYLRIGQTDYPICFTIPNLNPESIPAPWSQEAGDIAGGELHVSQQIRGTTISIDTALPELPTQQLQTITLEPDASAWEAMGRELVLERFPQIEPALDSGSRDISLSDEATGNLLLSFHLSGDGMPGMVQYLDVAQDLNGSSLDGWETVFLPHFLTANIPQGMETTPEEALAEVTALLERYSCFRFYPWNLQAEYDQQKQQGCYRIRLQPSYQELPIYGQRTITQAFFSNDGLFCCQGLMMLRESQREPLAAPLPAKQAVEAFVNSIPALSNRDTVRCDSIRLGYVAEAEAETIVLSPAWVFECSESSADNPDHVNYFEVALMMESGKFWDIQNGQQVLIDPL